MVWVFAIYTPLLLRSFAWLSRSLVGCTIGGTSLYAAAIHCSRYFLASSPPGLKNALNGVLSTQIGHP